MIFVLLIIIISRYKGSRANKALKTLLGMPMILNQPTACSLFAIHTPLQFLAIKMQNKYFTVYINTNCYNIF